MLNIATPTPFLNGSWISDLATQVSPSSTEGIIIWICVVFAVFFSIIPILPGTAFIFLGALGYGFTKDFEAFTTTFWVGQTLLAIIFMAVDNIAQLMGIKSLGGSKRAMWGSTIGIMLGPIICAPFLGPFALILGPPLGAMAGALIGEHQHRNFQGKELSRGIVFKLGIGALFSYTVGTFAKLVVLGFQIYWLFKVLA